MPDLLSVEHDEGVPVADAAVKPASAGKTSSKRNASNAVTANKRGGRQAELKYGGALTSALAHALAREPQKKTKDQLAESVLADVIAAMNAFPGVKLKKLWPLLKELGVENDGATFKRALVRALKDEAERQPVIALSLQNRSSITNAIKQQQQQLTKPGATAPAQPGEQALADATSATAQDLRSLRAPGF